MKIGWIVAGAIVTGVAIAVMKSAKNLQNLDIGISSVDYDSKNSKIATNARFKLKIGVYNPNDRDVKFKSFTGNLYYKDQRIANIDPVTSSTIVFKARQNSTIPLSVDIPTTKIASSFLDLLKNLLGSSKTKIDKVVVLKGSMVAENLTIPLTYNLDLNQI